jgi:hypothetical protein
MDPFFISATTIYFLCVISCFNIVLVDIVFFTGHMVLLELSTAWTENE